jgi:hypothetical protein
MNFFLLYCFAFIRYNRFENRIIFSARIIAGIGLLVST